MADDTSGMSSSRWLVREAFEVLQKAIQDDRSYAWSWHCNVAVVFIDEGGTHEQSNRAAARFMRTAFGVDVTTFDEWKSFPWLNTEREQEQEKAKNNHAAAMRLGKKLQYARVINKHFGEQTAQLDVEPQAEQVAELQAQLDAANDDSEYRDRRGE